MNTTKPRPLSQTPGHPRRCKCRSCRAYRNSYMRTRERRIAYGTWDPRTDAAPVRAHIRDLMAKGGTLRRIAAAAGCDYGYLGWVTYGKHNHPRPAAIRPDIAARVLAVTLDQVGLSETSPVDPTGTLRRLQAAHASGRSIARIARDLNRNPSWIQELIHGDVVVTARVADEVCAYYEHVTAVTAERAGIAKRWADAARAHAAELGWEPPSAWDYDIDDARAIANTDTRRRKQSTGEQRAWREAQQEDARLLTIRGYSAEAIAERLGVTSRTVVRWRTTNGWKAAA